MFSLPPRSSPPLAADPFQSISSSQNVVFHPALSLPTFQTVLESADSSALPNTTDGLIDFRMEDYVVIALCLN